MSLDHKINIKIQFIFPYNNNKRQSTSEEIVISDSLEILKRMLQDF